MEELMQGWHIDTEEAKRSKNLADINIVLRCPDQDGFFEISPADRKI